MMECFIPLLILGKNFIGELESISEIRNGGDGGTVGYDGF